MSSESFVRDTPPSVAHPKGRRLNTNNKQRLQFLVDMIALGAYRL